MNATTFNSGSYRRGRRHAVWPFCLVGISAVHIAPVRAGDDVEQEIVEIRGQRMAVWPVADLQARGFDVEDLSREDNAAWVYIEAANAYLDLPTDLQAAFDYAVASAWPENAPALGVWMDREENRKALELVRRASRMDDCQMPGFGDPDGSVISVLLPSLTHCRTLAKLLVVEGRRLEAEKKYDAALEEYLAAMRMGHHVGEGMTLIESLVGIACWSAGDATARDLILRRHLPEEPLARIVAKLVEMKALAPSVQRGFESERNFGPGVVDEITAHPFGLLGNFHALNDGSGLPSKLRPQNGWDRLEARLGRLFLPDRTIKRHMYCHYNTIVEIAKLPPHDPRVRSFDEEKAMEAIPSWNVLSRMLMGSLSRARVLGAKCRVDTTVTNLVAGLKLYAARHEGKPPATLADLAAELNGIDLIDLFSGRAFEYERTGDGWTLYSVGPDGNDDGGKSGERWDAPGDMVYTYPPKDIEPFVPESDEEAQP